MLQRPNKSVHLSSFQSEHKETGLSSEDLRFTNTSELPSWLLKSTKHKSLAIRRSLPLSYSFSNTPIRIFKDIIGQIFICFNFSLPRNFSNSVLNFPSSSYLPPQLPVKKHTLFLATKGIFIIIAFKTFMELTSQLKSVFPSSHLRIW